MKVTELMIGDYVKYQGHNYIIEEISTKGWVHLIHPETKTRINMTSDYIIDLLEPILLTKEILEKNGFTQCVTAPYGYYKAPIYDMFDMLFHVSEDAYEDTWHVEIFTDHDDKEVFTVDKVGLDRDYLQVHCIYNGEKDYWIDSCIIYTEDLISIFEFMLDN